MTFKALSYSHPLTARWFAAHFSQPAAIQANRTTLIFTNSRQLCEKLTFLINHHESELKAYAHHGSLSRPIRAEVEKRLKNGELKAIVATNSLVPIHKWLFSPISLLGENFNPRNINYMPAVKISARLELNENISFMDGQ